MINSNHIKRGMVLKLDSELHLIQSFQHHKPGKGAAVVRVKIKSLSKNTTIEKTFRSGEMLEDVELDKRPVTFSYVDGDSIVFMDTQNYEQISIPKKDIGEELPFLKEGLELHIMLYEGKPVSLIPPHFVELRVAYAEAGTKGDTATNPTKEVSLETGAKIQVPMFVKTDDIIKIDLRDFTYVERVSS